MPPDPTLRERILAGLGVYTPDAPKPNDYGPNLVARAALARRLERYVGYDAGPPESEAELRAAWGDR